MMLVDALEEKTDREDNLGFTEGMMTQSSQLMKIAGHVARHICPGARITMIPGSVTATVRASWNAWSLLAEVCPGVVDPASGNLMEKEAIRNVTHLHHAVDASMLGVIPLLIPAGTNGIVWQALGARRLSQKQVEQLRALVGEHALRVDNERRVHLSPLPAGVRASLVQALREERVVTHVPADMSGAKLEETTWGVLKVENGVASLRQKSRTRENGRRVTTIKQGPKYSEAASKLVGLCPEGASKLSRIRGARIIAENYGLALTPTLVVIPHHCVYKRLAALREQWGEFNVLRRGQLIRLHGYKDAKRNRVWRVVSVKNLKQCGAALDLQRPRSSRSIAGKHEDNWINVSVKTLLNSGMEILEMPYTGFASD